MKFPILLSTYFLFICNVIAQDSDSLLFWNNDVKLEWSDFRGKVPDSSDNAAMSIIEINIDVLHEKPYFLVTSAFNRFTSWSICSDDNVLIHEQLHFDIGELYVRKIRKAFIELLHTDSPYETFLNIIYDLSDECVKYNDLYDTDTDHGIIGRKQKLWNERIAKELNDLKEYENADD